MKTLLQFLIINNQYFNKNNKHVKDNDENDPNLNTTNLSVMVIRNRSKRLNSTNEQNSKLQGSEKQLNQISTQPNNNEKKDQNKLSDKELEHYKRVQRIMNSGPKVVGIFGVNNYNPENSMYSNRNPFTPIKTENNKTNTSNKINKTIRIGSKDNHNFVSVINKTRMVPIKKKKEKENKTKDKSKKDNNDDIINVINLEENFLSELKDDEQNENAGNESTSNMTNNNSKSNKNISNENIENEDNDKSNKSNGENNNIVSNNKNEVQGYFLNIINSKQNKDNENKKNNKNSKDEKLNIDKYLNENNEFFNNSGQKIIKVIKNNKIGIITKKHPKGLIPNNDSRITKLTINTDDKDVFSSINSTRYKAHNSLSKNLNHKMISNSSSITGLKYNTINDSSLKRSNSISVNMIKEERKNNKTSRKRSISKSKMNN